MNKKNTNNINTAVIGLGFGMLHAETYKKNKDCNLIYLCDFNKKYKKICKKKFNCNFSINANSIIANNNINLISIASYDNYHYLQTLSALKNKKHVFVEKPICQRNYQLKNIKKELKKNKSLKLSSNFVLRAHPKFLKIFQLIRKSLIGKVYHIEGEYNYGRFKKITHGWRGKMPFYSVTQGGGVHIIDLIHWYLNSKIIKVVAVENKLASNKTQLRFPDTVTSLAKLNNGATAKITSNFSCVTPHHHTLSVFGSRGTLVLSQKNLFFYRSRNKSIKPRKINFKKNKNYKGKVLESFIRNVKHGSKPIISKKETLNAMSVCFAIDKSIKTKKWEMVKY
jgi:predicted dehydrogenase